MIFAVWFILSLLLNVVVWFVCLVFKLDVSFGAAAPYTGGTVAVILLVDWIGSAVSGAVSEARNQRVTDADLAMRIRPSKLADATDDTLKIASVDRDRQVESCAVCGQGDRHGYSYNCQMNSSAATSRLASAFGRGVGISQPTADLFVARIDLCSAHKACSPIRDGRINYERLTADMEALRDQ